MNPLFIPTSLSRFRATRAGLLALVCAGVLRVRCGHVFRFFKNLSRPLSVFSSSFAGFGQKLPPSPFPVSASTPSRSRFSPTRAAALAAVLLVSPALLVEHASAVTYTWNGTTSQYWSVAENWVGGVVPVSANTTDIIISGTVNVGTMYPGSTAYTIKSLTFDASNDANTTLSLQQNGNNNTGARNLTFSSNSGNATLTVESGSTGNKTIDRLTGGTGSAATIILTSSLDIVHNGSGTLTLGDAVKTSVTGAGSINKSGTGTLILVGNSTYSGNTTISAGTLKAGSANALSSNSAVSVAAGAAMDLGGYNNTIKSLSTATGTITNSGASANLTITSVGSGAAQLFTGNLGLVLNTSEVFTNTNSTYSGGTYLNSGRLILQSTAVGAGTPGALTSGRYGTGTITLGSGTTSQAQ